MNDADNNFVVFVCLFMQITPMPFSKIIEQTTNLAN